MGSMLYSVKANKSMWEWQTEANSTWEYLYSLPGQLEIFFTRYLGLRESKWLESIRKYSVNIKFSGVISCVYCTLPWEWAMELHLITSLNGNLQGQATSCALPLPITVCTPPWKSRKYIKQMEYSVNGAVCSQAWKLHDPTCLAWSKPSSLSCCTISVGRKFVMNARLGLSVVFPRV